MAEPSYRARVVWGVALAAIGLIAIVHFSTRTLTLGPSQMRLVAHGAMFSISAIALFLTGIYQVRRGISPVRRFLDDREQAVRRAQSKAEDLAHGLKTPLAVLEQEAERVKSAGQDELAATIHEQVERMRRQIDYHLAQARASASGPVSGARCAVKESVEGIARTLRRLHSDRGLTIEALVSADHIIAGQREDLDEMVGNLVDNACKWAKSRVRIESSRVKDMIVIDVDDDGPGLQESMREGVLQRGVRADEAAGGHGLGLAIVRDLAELYGGSISLESAPLGGLRARLRLPIRSIV